MITYEIKQPDVPLRSLVQIVKDRYLGGHPAPIVPRAAVATTWGKFKYTKWLEEKVRPEWPVDTLCTLKAIAYVLNQIPHPTFKVVELQEVCWMAPIAEITDEPRAVVVRTICPTSMGLAQIPYPPGVLRKLTEEELKLVYLRNQTGQEPAAAANE